MNFMGGGEHALRLDNGQLMDNSGRQGQTITDLNREARFSTYARMKLVSQL